MSDVCTLSLRFWLPILMPLNWEWNGWTQSPDMKPALGSGTKVWNRGLDVNICNMQQQTPQLSSYPIYVGWRIVFIKPRHALSVSGTFMLSMEHGRALADVFFPVR